MPTSTLPWDDLKGVVDSKQLNIQYTEDSLRYDIFAVDGTVKYRTVIWKAGSEPVDSVLGSVNLEQIANDRSDFETNYKSDANGRILSQTSQPVFTRREIPPGATSVRQFARSNVAGQTDTDYVIPNGQKLFITEFQTASTLSMGVLVSNRVALFHDPNGNGTGMQPITFAYPAASNVLIPINEMFVGDGTAQIKIRRTPIDAGSREIFAQWEGYLI